MLLVVGHGGNAEPVNVAVSLLREEGRDVLAWSPAFDGDAHAGRTETSLALALDARRVDLTVAHAGETRPVEQLWDDLRRRGVRSVSPNGVLGDPTGADARVGRTMLEAAVDALCEKVSRWVST